MLRGLPHHAFACDGVRVTVVPVACPTSNNEVCHGRGKCVTLGFAQHQKTINGDLVGDLEVQTFTCSATSGTIQLSFNGFTTSSIAFSATAATVKAALEALPTCVLCHA